MNVHKGPFRDEVLCDILSMNDCHILLGRPWQFDRRSIYDYRRNLITIEKYGQKFTLASLREKEKEVRNLSLQKSCSVEKHVAKVALDGGMDLQKGLV